MGNPLFDQLFAPHRGSDAVFLTLPDGRQITYGGFLETVGRYANLLTWLGLKPGDRVAVQIAKSPEALAVYAACVQAGLVFLPLNTAYTPDELGYFVGDSEAGLLICDDAEVDALRSVAGEAAVETLNADGSGSFAVKASETSPDFATVARDEDDLAALLYTSGTTGRSKGAMLSQRNLLSNARILAEHWRFTGDDVQLHALPIFHTHGLFVATNIALLTGGQMIFLPKFDLDAVLRLLPQATAMMGVPTFYTRLLSDDRFDRDLVRNMRLFISGSAPLLADTHVAFEERTGHRILERYGMTETNMNTSNPYDGERRAGTVGMPLPGVDLQIIDDHSDPVPQGEIGQIIVRGPNVFQGYWRMPEKTAEELREDGFFLTGDLGCVDADGYVQIVGRSKDLIISGGYNVYPKEVELVLDQAPGVLESAVIGVPHPDLGEAVLGVLVADGGVLDESAILDGLHQSLARFKHPKALTVLPELPRNAMGKVQKNILRQELADFFERERGQRRREE
ncbi:malonate--CoA ligase [Yoonia sp. 2307UL14-13]|uniref:malonate--CoA ligase n=1 Tax=Yoonia sp. 2307UL14-13 TaxID=3126506 RepID=UPI003094CC88